MPAYKYDITVDVGAKWSLVIVLKDPDTNDPLDLTSYGVRMQMREAIDAETVLAEITTGNGRASIDGPAGKISLSLPASVTELISARAGVYDLLLIPPSGEDDRQRYFYGNVSFARGATR